MLEADIRTALVNDATVNAIVGTRVAVGLMPEGESPPYVTYSVVTGERFPSMSAPGTLRHLRVQLNCWAVNYAGAKALAFAVQDALDVSDLFAAVLAGEQDLQDPDTKLFYVAVDYSLWQDTA